MAPYVYWFLFALGLVILELVTGTFYMLVLALALGVGGLAALLELSQPMQFTLSAITGIAGVLLLRRVRRGKTANAPHQSLDIGQSVQSINWRKDGSVRALYRGAEWDAELESTDMPREGPFFIKALRGSTLILTHHKPEDQPREF